MRRILEDRTIASLPAAGAEVRAEDNGSPEEVVGVKARANGVADPAGLLKPKLRPVVEVVVETGVPIKTVCFIYLYKYTIMWFLFLGSIPPTHTFNLYSSRARHTVSLPGFSPTLIPSVWLSASTHAPLY